VVLLLDMLACSITPHATCTAYDHGERNRTDDENNHIKYQTRAALVA